MLVSVSRTHATLSTSFYYSVRPGPREPRPRHYLPLLCVAIVKGVPASGRANWMRAGNTYEIKAPAHLDSNLSVTLWHEFFEILSAHPKFPHLLPPEIEETVATQFAIHVLMPESDVRLQAAELHHPQVNKSFVLASRFGVSKSAMLIRLKELGLSARRGTRR